MSVCLSVDLSVCLSVSLFLSLLSLSLPLSLSLSTWYRWSIAAIYYVWDKINIPLALACILCLNDGEKSQPHKIQFYDLANIYYTTWNDFKQASEVLSGKSEMIVFPPANQLWRLIGYSV